MSESIELAERSVVGACLLSPERALAEAADRLSPRHFESRALGAVYGTMLEMQGNGERIDIVTLLPRLSAKGVPEEAAKGALTACMEDCPTTRNIVDHIGVIRKGYRSRRAAGIASELLVQAEEEDALSKAADELAELLTDGVGQRLESASELVGREYVSLFDKSHLKARFDTGYGCIDGIIDGIYPSDLFVIGARPAVGKTSLALAIAGNTAAKGKTVAFYSLEMSSRQLLQRYISNLSGVRLHRVKNADLDAVSGEVAKGCDRLARLPLYINDRANPTVAEIRNECRFLRGLGLILIDYLQLIQPRAGQRYPNRAEAVGQISRDLKILAKDLHVPVLVLSQLNRTVDGTREPTMNELRESGSIEQDADVIMLMWNPGHKEGYIGCKVEKNRNGGTGKACLYFDRERMRFQSTAEMPPEPKRKDAWSD